MVSQRDSQQDEGKGKAPKFILIKIDIHPDEDSYS